VENSKRLQCLQIASRGADNFTKQLIVIRWMLQYNFADESSVYNDDSNMRSSQLVFPVVYGTVAAWTESIYVNIWCICSLLEAGDAVHLCVDIQIWKEGKRLHT